MEVLQSGWGVGHCACLTTVLQVGVQNLEQVARGATRAATKPWRTVVYLVAEVESRHELISSWACARRPSFRYLNISTRPYRSVNQASQVSMHATGTWTCGNGLMNGSQKPRAPHLCAPRPKTIR